MALSRDGEDLRETRPKPEVSAMQSFALENVAGEAGIRGDDLKRLCEAARREFPRDETMFELHVLRACMAVRGGFVTLQDALRSDAGQFA